MNLFRKQVVKKVRDPRWGEVNISQPVQSGALFWIFILLFGFVLIFLHLAQRTQTENILGIIQNQTVTTHQFAPIEGLVSELFVQEGQTVAINQPLLSIKNGRRDATGNLVNDSRINALADQVGSIQEMLDGLAPLHDSERRELKNKHQSLTLSMQRKAQQLELARRRLHLAQNHHDAINDLHAKSLASNSQWHQAQEQFMTKKLQLVEAEQALAVIADAIQSLDLQMRDLPAKHSRQRQDLSLQLSRTQQQFKQALAQSGSIIKAERAGVISNLLVQPNQSVKVGQPLSSIMPDLNELIAYLYLPSSAAGFIKEGQTTHLKIDAFPFQKFGSLSAQVESISSDIVAGNSALPQHPRRPNGFYQIQASLQQVYLNSPDGPLYLKSGMTFSADVMISSRSLLSWMFAPLIGAVH